MKECGINKTCYKGKNICCADCNERKECESTCWYIDFDRDRNSSECTDLKEVEDNE